MSEQFMFSENDLTKTLNDGKELLITTLLTEGIIDNETAVKILEDYIIIVSRRGWFGRIWDSFRGVTEDTPEIRIVKRCNDKGIDINHERNSVDTQQDGG